MPSIEPTQGVSVVRRSARAAVARSSAQLLALLVLLAFCALASSGCANQKYIVPEKTQKKSQELYGQQQDSMQSLNQTGAEQAATAHENAVRPVEPDSEKPR